MYSHMAKKHEAKRARIEAFDYLNQRFSYEPETGRLRWKVLFPGREAGTKTNGCIKIALERLDFKAHRICWILYHGTPPEAGFVIDHKDGDPHNNRISNLRLCKQVENSRNSKTPKHNSSGFKGVARMRGTRRYRSYICVNRKQVHLGMHDTPEQAHESYLNAARKFFGEFACTDR